LLGPNLSCTIVKLAFPVFDTRSPAQLWYNPTLAFPDFTSFHIFLKRTLSSQLKLSIPPVTLWSSKRRAAGCFQSGCFCTEHILHAFPQCHMTEMCSGSLAGFKSPSSTVDKVGAFLSGTFPNPTMPVLNSTSHLSTSASHTSIPGRSGGGGGGTSYLSSKRCPGCRGGRRRPVSPTEPSVANGLRRHAAASWDWVWCSLPSPSKESRVPLWLAWLGWLPKTPRPPAPAP